MTVIFDAAYCYIQTSAFIDKMDLFDIQSFKLHMYHLCLEGRKTYNRDVVMAFLDGRIVHLKNKNEQKVGQIELCLDLANSQDLYLI